jgi:hypothetical protein
VCFLLIMSEIGSARCAGRQPPLPFLPAPSPSPPPRPPPAGVRKEKVPRPRLKASFDLCSIALTDMAARSGATGAQRGKGKEKFLAPMLAK